MENDKTTKKKVTICIRGPKRPVVRETTQAERDSWIEEEDIDELGEIDDALEDDYIAPEDDEDDETY